MPPSQLLQNSNPKRNPKRNYLIQNSQNKINKKSKTKAPKKAEAPTRNFQKPGELILKEQLSSCRVRPVMTSHLPPKSTVIRKAKLTMRLPKQKQRYIPIGLANLSFLIIYGFALSKLHNTSSEVR